MLTSLYNQSYSSELFEIIIADDDSEDNTAAIIKSFQAKMPNLNYLKIENRKQVISPKKNALAQAITKSKGDIILTTDADCTVGKYWIEAMVVKFDEETDMVCGFSQTQIKDNASLSQKFEHFDFLAMFSAAAGAISSNKYFSCSGQNLAYRKEAYQKAGGFEEINHIISGDDVNLMQLIRKLGNNISFNFEPKSYVYTKPVDNLTTLLNQRIRWTSNMKWQIKLNPEFFIYLLSVLIVTIMPWIILFINWKIAILFFIIRIWGEIVFLKQAFKRLKIKKDKLNFYPLWFVLQPFYMILIAILSIFDFFKWKK